MLPYAAFFSLPFVALLLCMLWRARRTARQTWRYRLIFRARLYWSVALLYALSGASVSFCAFGATHLRINPAALTMQIVAGLGLISMGLVRLLAGKLATPAFEANKVPQRDRNSIHALWMGFWVLGFAIGFIPLFGLQVRITPL